MCLEADVLTARVSAPYGPTKPFPAFRDSHPMPREVHLYSGASMWALAGIRGLLHRYLDEGGGPDDPEAIFMQGMLVGGNLAREAGSSRLFDAGYRP